MYIEEIFQRLLAVAKPAGKTSIGEELYSLGWSWKGQKEEYMFRPKDLYEFLEDIFFEHPRCTEYRKAEKALMDAEMGIVDPVRHTYRGPKAWFVDKEKYWAIRSQMMNLTTPASEEVKTLFAELGPNPTQGLSPDLAESKKLAIMLANKMWMSKDDFFKKTAPNTVWKRMMDALVKDPLVAIQTNPYIYSAFREYVSPM